MKPDVYTEAMDLIGDAWEHIVRTRDPLAPDAEALKRRLLAWADDVFRLEQMRLDYAILSDDYRAIKGNAAEAYERGMKAGIEAAEAARTSAHAVAFVLILPTCGVTGFRQGDRLCGYPRGHDGMHQWDS